MPKYLNTLGRTTLGIGICGRCGMKFPLDALMSDPNSPGLRVCAKDRDELDPYRLPARQVETITLPFTRPDEPIPTNPQGIITDDEGFFLVDEEFLTYLDFEE